MSKKRTIILQMDRAVLAAIEEMAERAHLKLRASSTLEGADVFSLGLSAVAETIQSLDRQSATRKIPPRPTFSDRFGNSGFPSTRVQRGLLLDNLIAPEDFVRGIAKTLRDQVRGTSAAGVDGGGASVRAKPRIPSQEIGGQGSSPKKLNRVASSHKRPK